MSSLLVAEPPVEVLPTLARRIGLNEAVVLQKLHYINRLSTHKWIEKTRDEWLQAFAFLSRATLEQTFASLLEQRLIVEETGKVAGQARYRVDYDVVDALLPELEQARERLLEETR